MTTKNVPMAYAAEVLSTVCSQIDEVDEIDAFLLQAFDDAKQTLAETVDRRIAFNTWSKVQLAAAEEAVEFYESLAAKIKVVRERFKLRTKEILEARPDLPYAGRLGKISLAGDGGQRAVKYAFGDKTIDPDTAALFGVPADYVIARTTYTIDTDRVRAELEAGGKLEWATLKERGTHVSFPRGPKQKAIEEKK